MWMSCNLSLPIIAKRKSIIDRLTIRQLYNNEPDEKKVVNHVLDYNPKS
jgi:hypothetical protein